MVSDAGEPLVKLILPGPHGEVDTPWALQLGASKFRLGNAPFYAYGVSSGDVVEASPTEEEGVYRFERVVQPSGNRTLRVLFENGRSVGDEDSQALLEDLLAIGAEYEEGTRYFLAVTVPPEVELGDVTTRFDARALRWEYGNPTREDVQGSQT